MLEWEQRDHTQHWKYCTICRQPETIVYEGHYGGTATCARQAICEGCGAPYGELSDEHLNMTDWRYSTDGQHRRWCLDCGDNMEYEDHYGGTATCATLAVCEGCSSKYGKLSAEHQWSEWSYFSSTSHLHVCTVCYEETLAPHHGGDDSCIPTCEDCKQLYVNADGKHTSLTQWSPSTEALHFRYCADCGEGQEYALHTGGTATCAKQAVCEDCGLAYGDYDEAAHAWGDWTPDGDGIHVRTCALSSVHVEYDECNWGEWARWTKPNTCAPAASATGRSCASTPAERPPALRPAPARSATRPTASRTAPAPPAIPTP